MEIVPIMDLLMPIIGSTVLVFIASFLVWMVLPHHRSDYGRLPDEDAARSALKGAAPGEYTFPHAASKDDWKSPEWLEKMKAGPNGFVKVIPSGPPSMGKSLVQWFIYCLVISIFLAYIAGRSLGAGAEYLAVFRLVGAVAFLAYAAASVPDAIWRGGGWGRTIKEVIDGLLYALLTAGVFGWLWP